MTYVIETLRWSIVPQSCTPPPVWMYSSNVSSLTVNVSFILYLDSFVARHLLLMWWVKDFPHLSSLSLLSSVKGYRFAFVLLPVTWQQNPRLFMTFSVNWNICMFFKKSPDIFSFSLGWGWGGWEGSIKKIRLKLNSNQECRVPLPSFVDSEMYQKTPKQVNQFFPVL